MKATKILGMIAILGLVSSFSFAQTKTTQYELGGMAFGLESTAVVLNNGQNESLVVTGSGAFVFDKLLNKGAQYDISITEQPQNKFCAIRHAKGILLKPTFVTSIHCDGRKIEQVNITDAGLAKCIEEYAQQQSWTYASQLTSLKCRDYGIKDISSLKYFPELQDVSLPKNQLSQVDLSSLSQVKFLNLNQNQLTSLDLSTLYELAVLGVAHNKLENLFFSEHPSLQTVTANDNAFTEPFVLSGLSALGWLDLKDNQIASFSLNDVPETLMGLNLTNNPLGETTKKTLREQTVNPNLTVEL